MESAERNTTAKKFNPPSEGRAGLYIFRKTNLVGGADPKDVWIDGKCIGETVPSVFFYKEVEGDKGHNVFYQPSDYKENPTETYLKTYGPPKGLTIQVKSGMNYFIHQYINFGDHNFVLVDEEQGKEEVSKLDMAKKGGCGFLTRNRIYDNRTDEEKQRAHKAGVLAQELGPKLGKDLYNMQSIGRSFCRLFC
ncbi:MAG: DUF2846 domain-containing protein [Nitrospina sp.]|nr:DUF2846 domain-containing protein [Nitrospina sp.]